MDECTTSNTMAEKDFCQYGSNLYVTLKFNYSCNKSVSKPYTIEKTIFQVKAISNDWGGLLSFFVRFTTLDQFTYAIKFTSKALKISNKRFISDDGNWHLVPVSRDRESESIDVSVKMSVVPSFAVLHDDMELTDFELHADDGSVHVHKAVLAASSPVLRSMLVGAWRETREGFVDIPDSSNATLQCFKDYLYLHKLPDTGLEQLLLLASYYMMPDLEQQCIEKLVDSLKVEHAMDLLEFAVKHKVNKLVLAILESFQNQLKNVIDIEKYLEQKTGVTHPKNDKPTIGSGVKRKRNTD